MTTLKDVIFAYYQDFDTLVHVLVSNADCEMILDESTNTSYFITTFGNGDTLNISVNQFKDRSLTFVSPGNILSFKLNNFNVVEGDVSIFGPRELFNLIMDGETID